MDAPLYQLINFSTDTADAGDDRREYWAHHVHGNHGMMSMDYQGQDKLAFRGTTTVQRAAGAARDYQLVKFASTHIAYNRSARHTRADGDRSARLVLPLTGSVNLTQGTNSFALAPGDLGLVRMDAPMGLAHSDHSLALILSLPPEIVTRHLSGSAPLALPRTRPLVTMLGTQIRQLSELAGDMTTYSFIKGSETIFHLLGSVLDEVSGRHEDDFAVTAARAEFVIRTYSDDAALTPQAVADQTGCSLRHLHRALAAEHSTTPAAMLRRIRTERAHARLGDPYYSTLDHIAHASGFRTAATLRAAYLTQYGVTPGVIRNNSRARG